MQLSTQLLKSSDEGLDMICFNHNNMVDAWLVVIKVTAQKDFRHPNTQRKII